MKDLQTEITKTLKAGTKVQYNNGHKWVKAVMKAETTVVGEENDFGVLYFQYRVNGTIVICRTY